MDIDTERLRALDQAITDAVAFLGLPTRGAFFDLAQQWPEHRDRLWANHTPDGFYRAWQGDAGRSNLCANVLDQFSRQALWAVLYSIVTQNAPLGAFLDYGCGSGALSFPFVGSCRAAVLVDLPNLAQEFLRARVQAGGLSHVIVATPEQVAETGPALFDLVCCIDVLEHLPEPTALFAQLDRWLKPGGLFCQRAPWATPNEPLCEHLPEAPLDWHKPGGGAAQLTERYELLFALDYGGLYRKLR